MRFLSHLFPSVLVFALSISAKAQTQTNVNLRVMGANLTSGNFSRYETPGLNIFKGLKPDVVAIQEFSVSNSFGINTPDAFSNMVATTFGTDFVYFREDGYSKPNGIISRYPILDSGSWDDPLISDRGFGWAQIDVPGTNNLYVVSVHLYSSGTASDRNTEAQVIKDHVQTNFPPGVWVIVAGDFNTDSRSEAAVTTFKTFLSDNPIPNDGDTPPDSDTNAGRDKPYDYVLPSFSLTNSLTNVVIGSRIFTNGLVFDSRVYNPLSDVSPVQTNDSGASQMQHMAVIKDFRIVYNVTNATAAPTITTDPQSQSVSLGSNATFTVAATGTAPLSYQWRFAGTNIGGATLTSYTRTNVQNADTGSYTVVITNTLGSVTSAVAVLAIISAPVISTPPQSQTVSVGQNATFTVTASGSATLTYQWRFAGTNIGGATLTTYTRANAQTNDAGSYTVVVTNSFGSITSDVATLTVSVAAASSTNIVISQIYGGGGNSGATYVNDFVELFNAGSVAVNVTGWSVQYASSSGTTWQVGNLNGSIQPYHYYLVQMGSSGAIGVPIPTAQATNSINISGANGKLALVTNQVTLTGSNPSGSNVVADFVGFGTANAFEGTATAPAGNNTASILRKNGGFTDSNDNTNDFMILSPPSPRNASSPANLPSSPGNPGGPATLSSPFYSTNKFQFTVTGDAGSNYVVQASTNLTLGNWLSLRTNVSPFTFVETNANTFTQRFYRVWSLP